MQRWIAGESLACASQEHHDSLNPIGHPDRNPIAADQSELAQAAGNRVLTLAHEPVTSLFIPAGRLILPRLKTYRRVLDAHRFIFDCLSRRDAAGAMTWMRKHMDDFRRAYEMTDLSLDESLDAVSLGVVPDRAQAARKRRAAANRR